MGFFGLWVELVVFPMLLAAVRVVAVCFSFVCAFFSVFFLFLVLCVIVLVKLCLVASRLCL